MIKAYEVKNGKVFIKESILKLENGKFRKESISIYTKLGNTIKVTIHKISSVIK